MGYSLNAIMLALTLTATALPAAAQGRDEISIEGSGVFDEQRMFTGAFTMSGAINDQGTEADNPQFRGVGGVNITRVMTMSGGEQIILSIRGSHVTPGDRRSDCPRPAMAPGTTLSGTVGSWTIESGTGRYSALRGTGSWESWVTHDANGPRAAKDCLTGRVQNAP